MTQEGASRQRLLEQREKFCQLLRKGYAVPMACREIGVPAATFHQLINEGKTRTTGAGHEFYERIRNAVRGKKEEAL